MSRGVKIALVVVSAGCTASEPEPVPEPGIAESAVELHPCPDWGCGENSPVIGPFGFHELHVRGEPNAEGFRIIDFQKNGVSYQPEIVQGSQLIASSHAGTLSGEQLTHGYFRITNSAGEDYKLFINKVSPAETSELTFWLGPPARIETYELAYVGPHATQRTQLCNAPPQPGRAGEAGANRGWSRPLEALLFTGDRYDARNKLVTAIDDQASAGWFNIACAGSAIAKLHLTRHTTAGSTTGFDTTAAQRQAMLKMYVSDVCGTGTAWTVQGVPLHWTNALKWSELDGNERAHEALWTASGARCLDTHRLGALYDNDVDGFRTECNPPPCPAIPLGAPLPLDAYVLSAVPEI